MGFHFLPQILLISECLRQTKVHLVKAVVFPVVMYGCESWRVRRRLLRVPWTAGRSTQPILKEISPGCPLEELMLKLKLQYFGHLIKQLTRLKRP